MMNSRSNRLACKYFSIYRYLYFDRASLRQFKVVFGEWL
jgi:hypothetical protein